MDESLRGYLTKYDNSSADINPLGSLTKNDIKNFLKYVIDRYNIPGLSEIVYSDSSAELKPGGKIT